MHSNQRRDETKKLYGTHMKANVEENTILMCPKIRATSYYAKNLHSIHYHIKYFQIRFTN